MTHGIRGSFLDFKESPFGAADPWSVSRYVEDGLLLINDAGRIADFGEYADVIRRHPGADVAAYPDRLIVPGFVDCHVHFPQTEMIAAYGAQLLGWLEKYVFPTELQFRDAAHARAVAPVFVDSLLAAGTTTAQVFTTTFRQSVDPLFEEASSRGMCLVSGVTGLDREGQAPDEYLDTADSFYETSKDLIEAWHMKGRNRYAITPRFALGSTVEQLERCGQLKAEHPDCWVNTHMSENRAEVAGVAECFPGTKDYLEVYEQAGLVGPKFTAGHSVHLDDDMMDRMSAAEASIAFCPRSNLFLGSGLFKIAGVMGSGRRIRVGFGTDMGGGDSFSILEVANDAYKVALLQDVSLSALSSLYLATLGGARALWLDDEIGSFDPGKYADVAVLDPVPTPVLRYRAEHMPVDSTGGPRREALDRIDQLAFGLCTLGDERAVVATYVAGVLVHERDSVPAGV